MTRTRIQGVAAAAVLGAVVVAPAFAQQQPTPAPGGAPSPPLAGAPPATDAAAPPVETGRLRRTHGGWRAERVIGAAVYNEAGERIGTVDDLIVGQDGKISTAVLSVGGLLGIGDRLVGVPYEQLRFEARVEDRTGAATGAPAAAVGGGGAAPPATTAAPGAAPPPALPPAATVRLVLPGATRDSLRAAPEFNYN